MTNRFFRVISGVLSVCMVFAAGVFYPAAAHAAAPYSRSETVYVELDGDGAIKSVMSSVYLENAAGAEMLSDETTLTDIKNISGLKAPVIEGSTVMFEAEEEDVIYQGSGSAEDLPIALSVQYTLNGKPITAEELAGASGQLHIRVQVVNREKHTLDVDGEMTELYTPFTVICMYTLGESFASVSTSGKLNNQAGTATVMGILHPGLAESLGDMENDSLTDVLTIDAKVQSLELPAANIIAMAGLVTAEDLSDIDDVQDLVDGLEEINDATKELRDGAKKLYNGTKEFHEGTVEFADGAQDLADGTLEAFAGSCELSDGIGETYVGVDALYQGLSGSLATGGTQGSAAYLSEADAAAIGGALYALVAQGQMEQSAADGILQRLGNTGNALQAAQGMQSSMAELAANIKKLRDGLGELRKGSVEFAVGMQSLAKGTQELADGTVELRDAADELQDGMRKLYNGTNELHREGTSKIVDETSSISVSLSRKDALLELSDSYTAYSAAKPIQEGSVQFMFTIEEIIPELPIEPEDSIEAETEQSEPQEEALPVEEKNILQQIWEKIMHLFK